MKVVKKGIEWVLEHTLDELSLREGKLYAVFLSFKCKEEMLYLCSGLLQLVAFTSEVKKSLILK